VAIKRDIVVVGGSAGAIHALINVVRGLPKDFAGSVFIVQHIPASSPSNLPEILSNAGPLQVAHAKDGERVQRGRVYVAPPDHHLLLEENRKIAVKRGPKENRFRPSIDALFRSAAYIYATRVIGVVLSGALDDGTSGLWTIKRLGGSTVVQEPEDASFPSMPQNAIEYVDVDHRVPATDISRVLTQLTQQKAATQRKISKKDLKLLKSEIVIARSDNAFQMGIIEMGELTPFTCPECEGALTRLKEGRILRFRCHTGHAFSVSALLSEVSENIEDLMWKSMRGLEESNMLLNQLGENLASNGKNKEARQLFSEAKKLKARSRIIHDSIFEQELVSGDPKRPLARTRNGKKIA
jgi:two-component system, chemotaxis family, protein-glutamate methylesterase/glutaminase